LCSAESSRGADETIAGVRVIRSPYYGTLLSQPLTPRLPYSFLKLLSSHDIVHVHTPNPLAETMALAMPSGKPIVISHHSDIVRQRLVLPFYLPLLHG